MSFSSVIAGVFRELTRTGIAMTITHIRHGTNTGNSDGTVTRGADVETNITAYFGTSTKDLNVPGAPNRGSVLFRAALLPSAVRNNDQFRINGQIWNIDIIRNINAAGVLTVDIVRS